jgi:hypothetical protein
MRLKLPRPRVRLRTLTILIAASAVTLWAGLNIWSPTRRLGRLLRPDQPRVCPFRCRSDAGA